jgi:lipid II isoglutaminyl synthase (glutamine-hydrolysing)
MSTATPSANRFPALPLRTRGALAVGRVAATASRVAKRGHGGVVGGTVALKLDPDALRLLARGRTTALVSGSNGKSTTAALLDAAVSRLGPAAYNENGSNMASGLVVALEAAREAPYAVLETDESYLGPVTQATRPRAIALLNLSRDYLERGVRYKPLARHWRETVQAVDGTLTVGANADDPIVTWAARGARDVVWVAGGDRWSEDGAICRDCIVTLEREGERWWCESCGQERPEPSWRLVGDTAEGPGISVPLALSVPGRMNAHNAVFALVAATALGVDPHEAAAAMATVGNVDGRYNRRDVDGRHVRLILAKNPASWQESIAIAGESGDALVFHLTARGDFNSKDASLAWDAPLERLAGRDAVATGHRASDIALRLEVAGLNVKRVQDPVEAILASPPGPVSVIGNYPAFLDLRDRLDALDAT